MVVGDDAMGFGHILKHARMDCGGATCDDDFVFWAVFFRAADSLTALADCFLGDGAAVDDGCIFPSFLVGLMADYFGLGGIESASERIDLNAHETLGRVR